MSDWLRRVESAVTANGFGPRTLAAGDGRLLVTVHGARVLGCAMPGVDRNLFWHAAELEQAGATAAFMGGDRLWIAPEVAHFWPSLEKARQDPMKWAATPPQIDPGAYEVVSESDLHLHLATSMTLSDHRVSKSITFGVERHVRVIDPPAGLAAVAVCSFGISNTLTLQSGDDGALAGAWDILVVPPTGTLICPTNHPAEPRCYFDPFGDRHVQTDPRRVRLLIDGKRRLKMGLSAEATTGRMGYYRRSGHTSSLILRQFGPLPGEPYVDVLISADPRTRTGGDALQAYNDDGKFGDFGEMEYHDPALVVDPTRGAPARRSGTCVTHVISGPDREVRAAGEALLGVAVEPLEFRL